MFRGALVCARQARRRQACAIIYNLLFVCCGQGIAAGATFTWTGASPNLIGIANNWGNPVNWQGGQIPVNDGTADVVIPDTPRDNSNVNEPWSIKSLTFQGPGQLQRERRPAHA